MSDDADSLVLRHLRRIDTKVDRLIDDIRDIKHRMTTVEESVAGQSRRLDRVEDRLDCIERQTRPRRCLIGW